MLRTPTSQLAINGGSQHPDKRKAGGHGPTLADEVEHLLPTPTARLGDATSRGADPARYKGPQSLNGRRSNLDDCIAAVEDKSPWLFPAPNASDWKGSGSTQGRVRDGRARPPGDADLPEAVALLPTPMAADGDRQSRTMPRGNPTLSGALLPTPQVADVTGGHRSRSGDRSDEPLLPAVAEQIGGGLDWGPYAFAVARWAQVTGIEPPAPVKPGRNGMRLSEEFVEWMQGLPPGWVTEVPGLSRNAKLKALGNGVVPQQAHLAVRVLARRVPRVVLAALAGVSGLWLMRLTMGG